MLLTVVVIVVMATVIAGTRLIELAFEMSSIKANSFLFKTIFKCEVHQIYKKSSNIQQQNETTQ